MSNNRVPIDPAAVTLMASIVAKSLKEYTAANPQVNLNSDEAIRSISESVAVDMISAVANLASQVTSVGEAPTRPSARQRAISAYKQTSSPNKPKRNDFLDRLGMDEEKQYPETD